MEISFFLKIYHQKWNYGVALSVNLFPWESKHVAVAAFKFTTTDIWARHDKTIFFVSWACLAAQVPQDSVEFIFYVCWGNTVSSLKVVKHMAHRLALLTPVFCFENPLAVVVHSQTVFLLSPVDVWVSPSWTIPCRLCLFSNSMRLQPWAVTWELAWKQILFQYSAF